ncbi:MAG: hypothetical protein ACI9ES_000200, partial [Oceanospirillaceae bacterium]
STILSNIAHLIVKKMDSALKTKPEKLKFLELKNTMLIVIR